MVVVKEMLGTILSSIRDINVILLFATTRSSLCPITFLATPSHPTRLTRPLWMACDCMESYSRHAPLTQSDGVEVNYEANPWTSARLFILSSSVLFFIGGQMHPIPARLNSSQPCFAFSLTCARGSLWREIRPNHSDTLQLLIATTHRIMPFSTISITYLCHLKNTA